jgi:oligopeptide transport system ATP-binding protein
VNAPLLEVAGLGVRYAARGRGRGDRPRWFMALADVDLVLHAGRSLGVVGESGSGKSTLARAILALVEPCAGEIRWQGVPVRPDDRAGLRRMRRELQPVFQDPFGSLDPRMTIGESVAEALQALEGVAGASAVRTRVQASLEEVGLDAALSRRYPHELSGGQCQRAAIARATVARPKLLVCDEAVSALDVSIQAQIVNLLHDLSQRHGMALLFISHNLAVVRHLCDEVLVLYRGRVVEQGPADALFATPCHPYTQALLAAVPEPDPDRAAAAGPPEVPADPEGDPAATGSPPGCAFVARCPLADERCASERPALVATGPAQLTACHHAQAPRPGAGPPR